MACKSCKFRYFLRLGSCYFLSFKEPLSALESFSSEGTFLNSETDLQQERGCQGNRPHPSCNSLSPLNFSPPNLGVLLRFPQILLISFSLFTSFFYLKTWSCHVVPGGLEELAVPPHPPLLPLDVGVAHNAHHTQYPFIF